MTLNVTLTETQDISGFIMVVLFTRNTMDPNSASTFDIHNIPLSTILFSAAIPAPILTGVEVPVIMPTLPVAPYYGLVFGQSATGKLSDMVPFSASVTISSLLGFEDICNARNPVYDNNHVLLGYFLPPGQIIGYRISLN
jgi:hypothetical protein